jgi:RNA polymerase sigma-70 factor (ECF subfamily)
MQLFLKAQPRVYSYLRTMVLNYNDAEDVFQEVASVLWQKFDEFKPGTRFDHWACKVAYHQALFHRQKRQRSKLVFGDDVFALIAEKAAAENEIFEEFQDAMRGCVQELPQRDREMVRLRFEAEATNRSVAHAMGRSETAISRGLTRVYALLLDCVQRHTSPTPPGGGT